MPDHDVIITGLLLHRDDANGDDKVSITDAVAVVDIILNAEK